MTTQRILLLSYLVTGVLVAFILQHLFGGPVAGIRGLSFLSRSVFETQMFWALVLGSAISIGVGLFCWFDPRVRVPATQVIEELQRVTWPTFAETRAATVAVIVATAICAVLLGLFDYGWGAVTKAIYSEASGGTPTSQSQ
jgi:preprotein translocase SecE subunit